MGEIAEMMLGGVLCEGCGCALDCDECEETGVPAYCSLSCAKDRGRGKEAVCDHTKDD